MNPNIQGELIARVERVKSDAVLLLEALYHYYPELPHDVVSTTKGCDLLAEGDSEAVKGLREWFRGKTSPESNSGSFAPSPTGPALENHLRELLLVNTQLSPVNRRDYMKTLSTIVANMPPAAHKLILDNVKEIKAFNTVQRLHDYVEPHLPPDERTTWGLWDSATGRLVLDGGSEGPWDESWERRDFIREGLYAHELTHSIDTGHQPQISKTAKWKEAYDEEIRYSTDPALKHARSETRRDKFPEKAYAEGFAEIGRFLYSGSEAQIAQNRKDFKARLPKCYAVFEEHRLIMKHENDKTGDKKSLEAKIEEGDSSRLVPDTYDSIEDGIYLEYWTDEELDLMSRPPVWNKLPSEGETKSEDQMKKNER